MVTTLLADKYAPITSEIGFLQCDAETVTNAIVNWQKSIQAKRGVSLLVERLSGDLESTLPKLLPLTSVEHRRTLIVPTVSRWTAYFDNGWRGTDACSEISYLSGILGCRGVRSVCVPNSLDGQTGRAPGRYGAVILELFSAKTTYFLNTERSIAAVNDGGKWAFSASGTPQEFEDSAQYGKRLVKDRFTPELLSRYLESLGIRAFDETFYDASSSSFLIRKEGAVNQDVREYSLQQARAALGVAGG